MQIDDGLIIMQQVACSYSLNNGKKEVYASKLCWSLNQQIKLNTGMYQTFWKKRHFCRKVHSLPNHASSRCLRL